jgi:hypothetical protein
VGTLKPLLAGGRVSIPARFSPKMFFGLVEQLHTRPFVPQAP